MYIIQNIIFPLMCFSDADEELWKADSLEYVRVKSGMMISITFLCHFITLFISSDIYEDLVSPVSAAQALLLAIIRKRKKMLESTMDFLKQILLSPNCHVRHKDGVFHMVMSMQYLTIQLFQNIIIFSDWYSLKYPHEKRFI